MTLPILWIEQPVTKKQFAILHLANFAYIDGAEENEEWPDGSVSRIVFQGGGGITVQIPYRTLSDMITEAVKKSWTAPIAIREEERKRAMEEQAKMMKEVLRDFHDNHS